MPPTLFNSHPVACTGLSCIFLECTSVSIMSHGGLSAVPLFYRVFITHCSVALLAHYEQPRKLFYVISNVSTIPSTHLVIINNHSNTANDCNNNNNNDVNDDNGCNSGNDNRKDSG